VGRRTCSKIPGPGTSYGTASDGIFGSTQALRTSSGTPASANRSDLEHDSRVRLPARLTPASPPLDPVGMSITVGGTDLASRDPPDPR